MKHFTIITLMLLCALAAGSTAARGQENVATQVATVYRPQTDTVEVQSAKMKRGIKNVVVVPVQYYAGPASEHYPVLYMLHGAWGSYRDWPRKAPLEQLATQYGVIIVCPDGQDSWYFDSPIDPTMQFETYVSKELVSYIDSHYRTYPTPYMRAIAGLSMGGHGALWLAWRHPDTFNSCGSMSGGVDITKFPGNWKIKDRLGKYEDNPQLWASHAVINLVPSLQPGQHITIDDGYDDIFYQVNLALHQALMERKIPHDFTIRPGKHTWDYWVNSLDYQMLFFSKAFKANAQHCQLAK